MPIRILMGRIELSKENLYRKDVFGQEQAHPY